MPNNFKKRLKEKKLQVKGDTFASFVPDITQVSPKMEEVNNNFISHQVTRKSKHLPLSDNEYFSCEKKSTIKFESVEPDYQNTVKE